MVQCVCFRRVYADLGKLGYDNTQTILEEGFGHPDMITVRMVINLRCGKPTKSAQEVLR